MALLLEGGLAAGASKSAPSATAQCVAVLCAAAGGGAAAATVTKLLGMLQAGGASPAAQRLALLAIGEVGRRSDLSGQPAAEAAVSAALSAGAEEVKAAAAVALGGIVCGNLPRCVRACLPRPSLPPLAARCAAALCAALPRLPTHAHPLAPLLSRSSPPPPSSSPPPNNRRSLLPQLLQQIEGARADGKRQYLLLQALSEVLQALAPSDRPAAVAPAAASAAVLGPAERQQVLALLLASCEGEEECRNVAAECMGRQALLAPEETVAALRARLASPSAHVRAAVVTAVKHVAEDKSRRVDDALRGALPDALRLLGDGDRHVRRAAVAALAAAAHSKPALLAPHLGALLPLLCEQTKVRPELIRTVDLGPFKHRIDDGLPLRKAAFEALELLQARACVLERVLLLLLLGFQGCLLGL